MIYILTSDRKIYSGTNEAYLYDMLRSDYTGQNSDRDQPNEIWINKAPCVSCAHDLDAAFRDRPPGNRPKLYVETLQYAESNYGELLVSIGCLAKLQSKDYTIKAWNWNTFKAGLQDTNSCTNEIDMRIAESDYSTPKAHLEQFVDIFEALKSDHTIGTWC